METILFLYHEKLTSVRNLSKFGIFFISVFKGTVESIAGEGRYVVIVDKVWRSRNPRQPAVPQSTQRIWITASQNVYPDANGNRVTCSCPQLMNRNSYLFVTRTNPVSVALPSYESFHLSQTSNITLQLIATRRRCTPAIQPVLCCQSG